MSKASIGDQVAAEMTEGQEADAVFKSQATAELSEDLPDGLENLRSAYQEFWEETHLPTQTISPLDRGIENLIEKVEPEAEQPHKSSEVHKRRTAHAKRAVLKRRRITKPKVHDSGRRARQRFGLPAGFVPRMQRFGRGVLLELNVYKLPSGQEFIPSLPSGTLGSRHLYALITSEQYMSDGRGSVYVRNDGRIFDYSGVSTNPVGDMFDTGYTIYDLERTGRYAPSPGERVGSRQEQNAVKPKAKKAKQVRPRRATAG
jgi:hypothetical protein